MMSTDKENQKKSELTDKSKGNKKDTSNSLERDAVGEFGSQNPTPMAQTDLEQDSQKKKKK